MSSRPTQREQIATLLDFSVNVNPFSLPRRVFSISAAELSDLARAYRTTWDHPTQDSLARFLGVPSECLLITAGASEGIFAIPGVLKAASGLVFRPSFWEYQASFHRAGVKVVQLRRKAAESFSLPRRMSQNHRSCKMVFLGNPDNPTSTLLPRPDIMLLMERMEKTTLVVDETYLLFRRDFVQHTVMHIATAKKQIIVVASLSKFFNVPGLRLGYVVASPSRIATLRQAILPYSVSHVSLAIAERMLSENEYIERSRQLLEQERYRVFEGIGSLEIFDVLPPEANFMLVKVVRGGSTKLAELLERHGIRIRPGLSIDPELSDWFRMCFRSALDNDKLISRLREFSL